jgi:hypothetical protein
VWPFQRDTTITAPGTRYVPFEVGNTGNQAGTYSLTCSALVGCEPDRSSVTLQPDEVITVMVGIGQGPWTDVHLTASNSGGSATGMWWVYSVGSTSALIEITPDGGNIIVPPGRTDLTARFAVKNAGTESGSVTLTCAHSGNVTCISVTPSSLPSLAGGATQTVVVRFNSSPALGTGTIRLTGQGPANQDEGSYTVQINPVAPGAPIVTLDGMARRDRSDCLTSGAGESAAFQCDELLLMSSMPAFTTLSEERRLTLLYTSGSSQSNPIVGAKISIPAGTETPDSIKAVARVGTSTGTYWYSPDGLVDQTTHRRIGLRIDGAGLATGVYALTLSVTNYYDNEPYAAETTGDLVIVNRSTSHYGRGWSVAGVDQLVVTPTLRDALLLVGSDGSHAVYEKIGTNRWQAPVGEFRDEIVLSNFPDPGTGTSQTFYRRRLRDSTDVYFTTAGNLRWVVDRVGQKVEYSYDNNLSPGARLTSIQIAPHEANRRYTFAYDPAGKLDYIDDPVMRRLDATVTSNELASLWLTFLPATTAEVLATSEA